MTPEAVRTLCKALGVVLFSCGAFGSLLCLPFAIGFDLKWIFVAGVYFVSGAVLMSGGLITYTLVTVNQK
ncbi:MAG: hypothetical protein WCO69_02610 [Candidatus Omnitrophota bacterium]